MEGFTQYTTTLRITLHFALQLKEKHMSFDSSLEPSFQFPNHKRSATRAQQSVFQVNLVN